jgi:bifunctional non-homologous end joining protein LigD
MHGWQDNYMTVKQHVEVQGRDLALTNLDKVLYPGSSVTKAQVIDYYIRVSKWLLPHFENLPVTMQTPSSRRGVAALKKKGDGPNHDPSWTLRSVTR